MERFVQLLVAGGVALVVGLWLVSLFDTGSTAGLLGIGLAALGAAGIVVAIRSEITVGTAGA
ncbi:MAG: hypothetical protein ABEH35_05520 [Haloarculaceae archaeon]